VLLIDSLGFAAIGAGFVLLAHTLSLMVYGYWEIRNEALFEIRKEVMAELGVRGSR
jgi:hypothetical protein